MEFILEKEVKDIIPQAVGFNFDQLKQELEVSLGKYQNIVVTEDATKEAKADRAKLNALKDTIDGKRKEIKKEWNVPYIEFENKVKILIGMIDEPIQAIDKQVKAYERKLKDDKQAEIVAYFKEVVGDLANLVPYEKIHVEKWLNSSERMSAIKKEITAIIETIQNDIAVIKGLEMECEQQMLDKYLENFSIADAMKEKARWEDRIMKIAEYEKQQEIKKQQEQAKIEALERARANAVEAEVVEELPESVNAINADGLDNKPSEMKPEYTQQLEKLDFRVFVTKEQKRLLKTFLLDNKIKYGRVE